MRIAVPLKVVLLQVALFALVACGGGGGGSASGNGNPPTPVPAPSGLSYTSPVTLTVGQAMASLSPAVTGTVASYAVSPALPGGISLNTTSGQVSGTPTATTAQASYTITATNASGNTTFALSLTINPAAPSGLSYASPQGYFVGQAITALAPSVTGTVTSFAVAPALPSGLALNAATGAITGTPAAVTALANYVITASNVTGNTTFNLSISVAVPPKFSLGALSVRPVSGSIPTNPGFLGLRQFVDLDGDGWSDLLWTGAYYPANGNNPVPQPGYVAFNGPGGFAAAAPSKFPYAAMTNIHAREFAFVDFNADGVSDVFIADHGYDATPFPGYQNRLLLSQGGQGTWVEASSNLPQQSDFTHSVCTGDVNADGRADIYAGNGGLTATYFLLGDGTGHFTQNSAILPINSGQALQNASVGLYSCALADLDGDNLPELLLGTDHPSRNAQVLWNVAGSYAGNTTAGGTITALPGPANFGTTWSIYEIQGIELNGDSLKDLIVVYQGDVSHGGWQIQFLVNQGNRQFQDQTSTYLPDAAAVSSGVPSPSNVTSWIAFLLPRDLNRDGRMDYWVEVNTWGTPNNNLPLALIRQANGSFVPVKVGELLAAGVPAYVLNGTPGYEARGSSQPGEIAQTFIDTANGNQVKLNAQAVTFH